MVAMPVTSSMLLLGLDSSLVFTWLLVQGPAGPDMASYNLLKVAAISVMLLVWLSMFKLKDEIDDEDKILGLGSAILPSLVSHGGGPGACAFFSGPLKTYINICSFAC